MCGIVAYIGPREAIAILLPALRRLEYRGYDSAGVATVSAGRLEVLKTAGKVTALDALTARSRLRGHIGIAHTRWATHGRPSDTNAHPHVDCESRLAIVHNGIIENYRDLRDVLSAHGHQFRSDTDTEVIAHLIEHYRTSGLPEAVRRAAKHLRGTYAIACIAEESPETLVAVRGGSSPLVIGLGDGEVFLASDIPALLGETRNILILEERELAVLTPEKITLETLEGKPVHRSATPIPWDAEAAEKGGYPHFMLKEIWEQPEAVRNTLRGRVDPEAGEISLPEVGLTDRELAGFRRVCFVACGTAWHAALIGKYLVESLARISVDAEIASEFRYRQPVLDGGVLTVPISQSGETADTLAALREAREQSSRIVAICNVVGSSVAREADGVFYTRAGLEVAVASTKAFTAQLTAVLLLALKLRVARGLGDHALVRQILKGLWETPELMAGLLREDEAVRRTATRLAPSGGVLYLGRGLHYPLALEGALKLKEVSYLHAEGYPAGEMKHGPIALIDRSMPVVAIAPRGPIYEKMAANIEEVQARDGGVIAIATAGDSEIGTRVGNVISIPPAPYWLQPLLVALPLQLLAYHVAVLRGCDVDQPRNLAKSVTVE